MFINIYRIRSLIIILLWQPKENCQSLNIIYVWTELGRENILILTDVSGIQRLRVSDFGEKFTIPIQLKRVRITHATMVTSGCKATYKYLIYFLFFGIFSQVIWWIIHSIKNRVFISADPRQIVLVETLSIFRYRNKGFNIFKSVESQDSYIQPLTNFPCL